MYSYNSLLDLKNRSFLFNGENLTKVENKNIKNSPSYNKNQQQNKSFIHFHKKNQVNSSYYSHHHCHHHSDSLKKKAKKKKVKSLLGKKIVEVCCRKGPPGSQGPPGPPNPDGITQLVGDITAVGPGIATTTITTSAVTSDKIASEAITDNKLASMPPFTIKGNNTVSSSPPQNLTVVQSQELLSLYRLSLFGLGFDGHIILSTAIILTRNVEFKSLTITGGGSINTDGYSIRCQEDCDLSTAGSNAIYYPAPDGGNSSGNSNAPRIVLPDRPFSSGGSGGVGVGSTGSSGQNGSTGGRGCNGGISINGGPPGVGSNGAIRAGGIAGTSMRNDNPGLTLFPLMSLNNLSSGVSSFVINGGAGGGGGGQGSGTSVSNTPGGGGGSGGAGGNTIYITCRYLIVSSSTAVGAISVPGGNGGNGATSLNVDGGGGSGGCGGGGGYVYLVVMGFVGSAIDVINVSGGSGGSGGNGIGLGTGGGSGSSGGGGSATIINAGTGTSAIYPTIPVAPIPFNSAFGTNGGAATTTTSSFVSIPPL